MVTISAELPVFTASMFPESLVIIIIQCLRGRSKMTSPGVEWSDKLVTYGDKGGGGGTGKW